MFVANQQEVISKMTPEKSVQRAACGVWRRDAQATLEFAIFFPLFALVIAMIIQFSWLLLAEQRVEMASFRGALYAAKQPQSVPIDENSVRAEILHFFPDQQQSSVSVGDFDRIPGPEDQEIDYAELNVQAKVNRLFDFQPFKAMWQGIAGASLTRAERVAERIEDAIANGEITDSQEIRDTIDKIEKCYDEYSGGTYTVCAFHKIAYDPKVPFSKD